MERLSEVKGIDDLWQVIASNCLGPDIDRQEPLHVTLMHPSGTKYLVISDGSIYRDHYMEGYEAPAHEVILAFGGANNFVKVLLEASHKKLLKRIDEASRILEGFQKRMARVSTQACRFFEALEEEKAT